MRGGETEQYVHLSNIHICLHALHKLEYHIGVKKKTTVINIKLNLHCFTKLPSSKVLCGSSYPNQALWNRWSTHYKRQDISSYLTSSRRAVSSSYFFCTQILRHVQCIISREQCPRSPLREGIRTLLLRYTWNKLLRCTAPKSMKLACPHKFRTGLHTVNEQQTRKQYSEFIDKILPLIWH